MRKTSPSPVAGCACVVSEASQSCVPVARSYAARRLPSSGKKPRDPDRAGAALRGLLSGRSHAGRVGKSRNGGVTFGVCAYAVIAEATMRANALQHLVVGSCATPL